MSPILAIFLVAVLFAGFAVFQRLLGDAGDPRLCDACDEGEGKEPCHGCPFAQLPPEVDDART